MPATSFTLQTLAEIAQRLPANCWIASRYAADNSIGDEPVLLVSGDLRLSSLHLDMPLSAHSELARLCGDDQIAAASLLLIFITGDLSVDGAVYNENTDGAASLIVLGDAAVGDVVIGGQFFHVEGALNVANLLWGDYNHGNLVVMGNLSARVAVFTDEYHVLVRGKESVEFLLDETRDVKNLTEFSFEPISAVFEDAILDGTESGDESLGSLLNRDAALDALRDGGPVVRASAAIRERLASEASDLFADDEISIANVLALVNSGLIEPGKTSCLARDRQMDFVISMREIDSDGDQLDDRVFITDWKTYDFYIGVAEEPPKGLLAKLIKRAPERELNLSFRSYESGEPQEFESLSEENEAAWAQCAMCWRAVLDYVRKGVAQQRAGYPLWRKVNAEITREKIESLTSLPVFVERYNDWWDSDKNGYWDGNLWFGARQPGVHDGEPCTRMFKIGWENGEARDGDDDDDAHGGYWFEFIDAAAGVPTIDFDYSQRQSSGRYTLKPHAADHLLRMLRLFRAAEIKITADHEDAEAQRAETARIAGIAQLCKTPPYAADVRDEEIFPAQMLSLSQRWQSAGKTYVAAVKEYHRHMDAGKACDEVGADPRIDDAATVLQLARRVNEHSDALLAQRFRARFAFAPDALRPIAQEHGQFIGPIFSLDDGRVIVRVGPAYEETAQWMIVADVSFEPLPQVVGVGRSMNRRVWAVCEGEFIATRDGFSGPQIARFELPTGIEGLPESLGLESTDYARRCNEMIPFNDGKRVLLRNATGVYLLTADGVRRIHPQAFDEDGPYTWPKNQFDNGLALDMLHMALSPDEHFIALGDQDSRHILLNGDGRALKEFEPLSDYPHCAVFSPDSSKVAFNSCHLYSGATLLASTQDDDEPATLDSGSRVYAAVATKDAFIVGSAEGYLDALSAPDNILWRHHVGSSMSGIEISADERVIWAASYGGYLVRLERFGHDDPFSIGHSPYSETARWIFWQNEPRPLRW